ncbi:flavin reductase family protein [Pectobacterium brasiliense]|uniref:flavin reductase family protein n=1 Tax=Pectobacterium brasiliense TaxID=180957 RepID=UPI002A811F92|nr:flavin reductase [Pectobacterium brasiliense]
MQAHLIHAAGTTSGKDVDKFKEFSIGFESGIALDVPILTDSYLSYECKVIDLNEYGDHIWVVGEIQTVYKDITLFNPDGSVDLEKLSTPLYIGRSIYRTMDGHAPLQDFWKE